MLLFKQISRLCPTEPVQAPDYHKPRRLLRIEHSANTNPLSRIHGKQKNLFLPSRDFNSKPPSRASNTSHISITNSKSYHFPPPSHPTTPQRPKTFHSHPHEKHAAILYYLYFTPKPFTDIAYRPHIPDAIAATTQPNKRKTA